MKILLLSSIQTEATLLVKSKCIGTVFAPPSSPPTLSSKTNKQTNNFESFFPHSTSFFKNVGFARGTFLSPLKQASTLRVPALRERQNCVRSIILISHAENSLQNY